MQNLNSDNVTINLNTLPGHTARLVRDLSSFFNGKAGLYECTPGIGHAGLSVKGREAPRFVVISALEKGLAGVPETTVFTGSETTKDGLASIFPAMGLMIPCVVTNLVGSQDPRAALALMGYALITEMADDDETPHDIGGEA